MKEKKKKRKKKKKKKKKKKCIIHPYTSIWFVMFSFPLAAKLEEKISNNPNYFVLPINIPDERMNGEDYHYKNNK